MVEPKDVPWWWVVGDLGHALLSESPHGFCQCGHCPRYESVCGIRGDAGRKTTAQPASICRECREILASPCIGGPTREGVIR